MGAETKKIIENTICVTLEKIVEDIRKTKKTIHNPYRDADGLQALLL